MKIWHVFIFLGAVLSLLILGEAIRLLIDTPIPKNLPVMHVKKMPFMDVAHWHLFGKLDSQHLLLPKTQLPIVLEGTLVNEHHAALSYALINDGKTTKTYRVGERIDQAEIKAIHHKNIVLKHHGQLESLALPIQKQ